MGRATVCADCFSPRNCPLGYYVPRPVVPGGGWSYRPPGPAPALSDSVPRWRLQLTTGPGPVLPRSDPTPRLGLAPQIRDPGKTLIGPWFPRTDVHPARSDASRTLAVVAGVAILASLVSYAAFVGVPFPGANGEKSPENATLDEGALEELVVEAVNERRAADGLAAVEPDSGLAAVARNHSADMVEREYYAHESPEGAGPADRLEAAGVDCGAVGENIATTWYREPVETEAGTETYDSTEELAEGLLEQWERSRAHRANMLDPRWEVTGVGVETDGDEVIATQLFCTASR